MKIRVLVVDDHALIRDALAHLLAASPKLEVVGRTDSGEEAIRLAAELRPDVILMDVCMPEMRGPEAAARILAIAPEIRIIMLSASIEEFDVLASIQAGAAGYLHKTLSEDQLLAAIKTIHAGQIVMPPQLMLKVLGATQTHHQRSSQPAVQLTDRERDILSWIAGGGTNAEVAARLGISVHTVKTHLRNIMRKLELENRAQVVAFALRSGCARPREVTG